MGALIICVGMYSWAQINSRCSSTLRSKQSLLYLARQHLGEVHRSDFLDHACFLQSVEGLPCGVEVPLVGLVSMRYVGHVIRFVSISVPVIVGATLRLAADSA